MKNKIILARKISGLTQEELSIKMKVPRSTIANWETGKFKPSNKNLGMLSKLLGKPKVYFLADDTLPPAAGSIGARVAASRQNLGQSLKEFAKNLGISFESLKKIEADIIEPNTAVINKLSELTGEGISYFYVRGAGIAVPAQAYEVMEKETARAALKHSADEVSFLKRRIAFYEAQISLKDKQVEQLKKENNELKKLIK